MTWKKPPPAQLLPMIGGPAAIGLCLGLDAGLASAASGAFLLPLIVLGVALFTLPTLYITSTATKLIPELGLLLNASLQSLREAGLVMLGLIPTLLLLIESSPSVTLSQGFGMLCIAAAMLLGLRSFLSHLLDELGGSKQQREHFQMLFMAWSVVSLGIGYHFFDRITQL